MKINSKSQLGLNFTKELRDFIYNKQMDIIKQNPSPLGNAYYENMLKNMISDDKNTNFLFTKSALAVADKIKIDKFEANFFNLEGRNEKKITFLIDNKLFYRVIINAEYIYVMIGELRMDNQFVPQTMFYYTNFRIIPNLNAVSFPGNEKYMEDERFRLFIKLLIFFEFSETQIQELYPNRKIGTRREGKFFNESAEKIKIVDSTWNKIIMVLGKFSVRGHFRLQRYGEQLKERKLIFIDEYEKDGYTRNAKKELSDI
jgi:hypothetical protein